MTTLRSIKFRDDSKKSVLSEAEIFSVFYHNIFDYPLTFAELIKWKAMGFSKTRNDKVIYKNGVYFLQGREGLIYKRALRERISAKKMQIAKSAAETLSKILWIRAIGVTGSLAMKNSDAKSDVDLLIIVKNNTLWISRLAAYFLLFLSGIKFRKQGNKFTENALCLNMWFDEGDLVWKAKRNLYTAHEIAQITPILNKNKTFEKFIEKNNWITKYWPNAVKVKKTTTATKRTGAILSVLNKVAFKLQYLYMKPKITREIVSLRRAIFHPHDWAKVVLDRIDSTSIK